MAIPATPTTIPSAIKSPIIFIAKHMPVPNTSAPTTPNTYAKMLAGRFTLRSSAFNSSSLVASAWVYWFLIFSTVFNSAVLIVFYLRGFDFVPVLYTPFVAKTLKMRKRFESLLLRFCKNENPAPWSGVCISNFFFVVVLFFLFRLVIFLETDKL